MAAKDRRDSGGFAITKGQPFPRGGPKSVTRTIKLPPSATASTTSAPTQTASAPGQTQAAASPITPYLTPQQQNALDRLDFTYGSRMSGYARKIADARTKAQSDLAASAQTHLVKTDQANQVMAARGLFQSSIRDAELNDLDASMTMRNNLINANLNRLILDTNSAMGTLTSTWVADHNMYNSMSVANAQVQTPSVDQTTPTATTPTQPPTPTPGQTPAGATAAQGADARNSGGWGTPPADAHSSGGFGIITKDIGTLASANSGNTSTGAPR